MRSLSLRHATVAAVVPIALGALAACGSRESTSTTAPDPQATTSATSSGSASPSAGPAHQNIAPAAFLGMLKSGFSHFTTARFTMTMGLAGQSIDAKGAMDLRGGSPAFEMSMDLSGMGTPTRMILVDKAMYIQVPGAGDSYFKMDLSDPNGPLGDAGKLLDNLDPQSMISRIPTNSYHKVTYVGTQRIGGQQVKHYVALVDTKAAQSMLQNAPSGSLASLPKQMTYNVWLDGQNRVVRFKMLMHKLGTMTGSYSDFGADLNIHAPDPAKVQAMPSTGSAS